jgi:hypothetical protein
LTTSKLSQFHITTSFGLVDGLKIKRWGFWPSYQLFDLPTIPDAQVESVTGFNMSGLIRNTLMVENAYFHSSAGKACFAAYLEQLKRTIEQQQMGVDKNLLTDLVNWSFDIHIQDPSSPTGTRIIDTFTLLGYDDLEKTALLLKQPSQEKIVINDDESEDEHYDQYLSLCHYAAVEGDRVELHFNDFNSDDFETLHKVTLDRYAFANATFDAYTRIKKQVDSVCNALGVNLRRVVTNI